MNGHMFCTTWVTSLVSRIWSNQPPNCSRGLSHFVTVANLTALIALGQRFSICFMIFRGELYQYLIN